MNVIPAIDLLDGQCVRLYQGDFDQQTVYADAPLALAEKYESIGCSALHIVDLDGASSGQQQNQGIIRKIVEMSELKIQLGGGLRTESEIVSWFDIGISRVVIGSLAVTQPYRVRNWLTKYGPEKIVLALDVRVDQEGAPHISTHGWRKSQEMTLWQCIEKYVPAGAKHILCTDVSCDGAMAGPNLGLYREFIRRYPEIQLQASGGVRSAQDLAVLRDIGANAAVTGRALLDGKINAEEIRTFLPGA